MKADVIEFLSELRKRVVIGFVGGSDLPKQLEQLGADGTSVTWFFCIFIQSARSAQHV